MTDIKGIRNPWRDKYQTARFRGAMFYVETEARQGGRRVAVHEFPKRNVDYAEDMGRAANRFAVQGYLIGPNYLDFKNNLIAALEKDGPGWLRLPMPYQGADVQVMVVSYSVTEARERGGFCQIDMAFVEYGNPEYRETISTGTVIDETASRLEASLVRPTVKTLLGGANPYAIIYSGVKFTDPRTGLTGTGTAIQRLRPGVAGFGG